MSSSVAKTVVVTGGKQPGDKVTQGFAGYDYLRGKGLPDKALKVEVEGNRGKDPDPFWWPKQAMRFVHTIWYAPGVGRYVKARHQAWAMTGNLFADDGVHHRAPDARG